MLFPVAVNATVVFALLFSNTEIVVPFKTGEMSVFEFAVTFAAISSVAFTGVIDEFKPDGTWVVLTIVTVKDITAVEFNECKSTVVFAFDSCGVVESITDGVIFDDFVIASVTEDGFLVNDFVSDVEVFIGVSGDVRDSDDNGFWFGVVVVVVFVVEVDAYWQHGLFIPAVLEDKLQ